MQEEKEQKKEPKRKSFIKKIGAVNLICVSLFVGSLCLSAGAVAMMYRNVHTNSFGEYTTALPWSNKGVSITNVKNGWMDVSDNSWMRMNEITHAPYIQLELAAQSGSGTLFIQFKDDRGRFVGELVGLIYRDGQFEATDRQYYKATGNTALIYGIPQFDKTLTDCAQHFLRHSIDERRKHWIAEVSYIPAGTGYRADHSGRILLGQTTIAKRLDTVAPTQQ